MDPWAALKWLDLVLLALALPLFLLAGLPMAGYAAAAGAWLAQRAIQVAIQRRASTSEDPRTIVGLTVGGMIARGWIVAGTIFSVGVGAGDENGLAAAILLMALFSVYFTTELLTRPLDKPGAS